MTTPLIDYTARDFDTIREALRIHVQTKFGSAWRNFYESGFGTTFLELIAYVADCLSFYCDRTANEMYLPTAQDRSSIINLCKLIGYSLRPATSAGVTCTATLDAVQASDVLIAAGTTLSTTNGVQFVTLQEQRITAGSLTAELDFTEGRPVTDNYVSDGSAYQKFKLSNSAVAADSVEVTVAGETWSVIDSLVYGDQNTKCFTVEYDADDFAYIQFGDGTSGAIPATAADIVVDYRVGGGVAGNIGLNELTGTVSGTLDGTLPPVTVNVAIDNDVHRGSGGEARETEDHARFWAPLWVQANGRAVTLNDFEVLGTAFVDPTYGSAAYVSAKLHQEIPEYNLVDLYVWARDSFGNITTPSTGLKNALLAYFTNNDAGAVRIVTVDVTVNDGQIVYVDLDVKLKVQSTYASVEVTSAVNTAITNFFNSTDVRPGWDLRISKLYQAIQAVAGVEYALLTNLTASTVSSASLGVADGITNHFTGTIPLPVGRTITPHSLKITCGGYTLRDFGRGYIGGDIEVDPTKLSVIDYDTGVYDIYFVAIPEAGLSIDADFKLVETYARGNDETLRASGLGRVFGALDHTPIIPGTLAFSDGTQVVTDDGAGNLVGDIDAMGANTIDYQTGQYDFEFTLDPTGGTFISISYLQLLRTDSEDLPMDRQQLAVKNNVTITTVDA